MNITITHAELTSMFKRLTLAKNRQWCATFSGSGGIMVAVARDDNMTVSAVGKLEGIESFPPITLPLTTLDKWLRGLHGGDVIAAHDGQLVTFTCGDATLPVRHMGDTMIAMPEEPKDKLDVPAGTWGAVKWVAYAAATDTTRPLLCQVNLQKGRVFATDSYRLAKVDVPGLNVGIGIPTSMLKALDKVDVSACDITVDSSMRIHLSDDAGRFVFSTNVGDPPNIDPLIPTLTGRSVLTVLRDDMLDAVKHLGSVKLGQNTPVRFHTEGSTVTLSVETGDGPATRTLPHSGVDEAPDFAVNSGYLVDVLDSLTTDTATFYVDDNRKPIVWQEDAYMALQMPVRIAD